MERHYTILDYSDDELPPPDEAPRYYARGWVEESQPIRVLLIEPRSSGDSVFLYYVSGRGEILADTWHASLQDAKQQAASNFDGVIESWQATSTEEKREELVRRLANTLDS
jgi:hypothetical protein